MGLDARAFVRTVKSLNKERPKKRISSHDAARQACMPRPVFKRIHLCHLPLKRGLSVPCQGCWALSPAFLAIAALHIYCSAACCCHRLRTEFWHVSRSFLKRWATHLATLRPQSLYSPRILHACTRIQDLVLRHIPCRSQDASTS